MLPDFLIGSISNHVAAIRSTVRGTSGGDLGRQTGDSGASRRLRSHGASV